MQSLGHRSKVKSPQVMTFISGSVVADLSFGQRRKKTKMSAGTSSSFCLIFCFLVCSSGAQKIIRAELGKNIILPCKVPDNNINNIRAVEWIRPDQEPEYVLFYRDGHFDPYNQHPSYQNRVDLQDKEMKDGNFSLILMNVKMEDTGTYECRVFGEGNNEPISIINLEVLLPAQTIIRAELGMNIILPCKVLDNNNNIRAIEWSRPGHDPEYVLFYRDGRLDPDNQHPSYQNRVDLQDEEMKDGDVSLILKVVKMEDNGTYECHVFHRETNRRKRSSSDPINIINLEVLPSGKLDESSGDKVGITRGHHGLVGCVILLLLAVFASVGFLIFRSNRRQNPNIPVPPDETAAKPTTVCVTLMEPAAAEQRES